MCKYTVLYINIVAYMPCFGQGMLYVQHHNIHKHRKPTYMSFMSLYNRRNIFPMGSSSNLSDIYELELYEHR